MTTEEQLRDLMIKKSGSVNRFAQEVGISQSTIFSILSRGINKANIESIITICRALSISADELAEGRITPMSDYLFVKNGEPVALIEFEKLTPMNQQKLLAYYEGLLDSQKEN